MAHGTGAPQRGRGIEEALYRLFGHRDHRTTLQRIGDLDAEICVETLVWFGTTNGFVEINDRHPSVRRLRELIEERRRLISQ